MPVDHDTRWDGIIIRIRQENGVNESVVYPTLVLGALNTIYAQRTGKRLLDRIVSHANKKKFGYTVCIMRPDKLAMVKPTDGGGGPRWSAGNLAKRMNESDACNGAGTITAVTWNANSLSTPGGARPPFIGLAHELIHALYSLEGKGFLGTDDEELRTVGLAPYANKRSITENKIRAEHGIALRTEY